MLQEYRSIVLSASDPDPSTGSEGDVGVTNQAVLLVLYAVLTANLL
jgi:hypothetical protein